MREYRQELFAQKTPYLQWLRAQEEELERQYGQSENQDALGKQIHTLPFSSCMDRVPNGQKILADEVYLFVRNGGVLSDYAVALFAEVFSDNYVVMAYADEDYRGGLDELYGIADGAFDEKITQPYRFGENYRGAPWFKPDFSPDTLASFFYIGSIFAVRGNAVLAARNDKPNLCIYEFVYKVFMEALDRRKQKSPEGIVHIPKVLYTNDCLAEAKRLEKSDKIWALYKAKAQSAVSDKVSIIIPSKDHARTLEKCLATLTQYTVYPNYEIIIVDNGSSAEQKEKVIHIINTLKKQKRDLVIRYLYQERVFHFSAMCNAGVQAAEGTYLLFLNDDIEILDTDAGRQWLDSMMLYSKMEHIGAVGAKLYYPPCLEEKGRYRIQHVGITNMGVGPAHKLGGRMDEGCLYHGHNTQNYDMIAVTAACMLIRRCVFDKMGGFDETFPIAYNDVELCFRLYREGYFNVQVNDAVLIHHESLSRGQDTTPEKQRRLSAEKNKLYKKHELLRARDPFYSPNLVQWKRDTEYNTEYCYDFDKQMMPVFLGNDKENNKRKQAIFRKFDFRSFLYAWWRPAAKIYDRLTGYDRILFQIDFAGDTDSIADSIAEDKTTDTILTIEGWCAVAGTDNAKVSYKLWLIYEMRNFDFRSVYEFEPAPKLREDVAALLEGDNGQRNTKNTALAGIQINVDKRVLKSGTYKVCVLCGDKLVCALDKLIQISN